MAAQKRAQPECTTRNPRPHVYLYINEKKNTANRRTFSEYTPVDKHAKTRLNADNMETNMDDKDENKPTIAFNENKKICDDLASIIFWTGFKEVLQNKHKMIELEKLLSTEDYNKINNNTVHTKHQTRIILTPKKLPQKSIINIIWIQTNQRSGTGQSSSKLTLKWYR